MSNPDPAQEQSEISKLLPGETLKKLREGYNPDLVAEQLEFKTPHLYMRAQRYFSAVVDTFFEHLPYVDSANARIALNPDDRQRCILALQAATGQESPLAIHIYIGLMEGLGVDEIANILLLAGVYTGVPNFFTGLSTLATTLKLLAAQTAFTPDAVLTAIQQHWTVGVAAAAGGGSGGGAKPPTRPV